jgi:hypothetical protein
MRFERKQPPRIDISLWKARQNLDSLETPVFPYKQEVAGSISAPPTILNQLLKNDPPARIAAYFDHFFAHPRIFGRVKAGNHHRSDHALNGRTGIRTQGVPEGREFSPFEIHRILTLFLKQEAANQWIHARAIPHVVAGKLTPATNYRRASQAECIWRGIGAEGVSRAIRPQRLKRCPEPLLWPISRRRSPSALSQRVQIGPGLLYPKKNAQP